MQWRFSMLRNRKSNLIWRQQFDQSCEYKDAPGWIRLPVILVDGDKGNFMDTGQERGEDGGVFL